MPDVIVNGTVDGVEIRDRLKQFDQSNAPSRRGSQAATPPKSVVGIGGKGAPVVCSSFKYWELSMKRHSCKAGLFRGEDCASDGMRTIDVYRAQLMDTLH